MPRMYRSLRSQQPATRQGLARWLAGVGMALALTASAAAQQSAGHQLVDGNMPPGAIGRAALVRSSALANYFQPVEIRAAEGTFVSLAVDGQFSEPQPAPLKAGLLIAPVYRLRVMNHPHFPGRELYPTIEVIDRLYPPPGYAAKFPIPIELTDDDIRLAMEGHFVTRVIYLEDPHNAIPVVQAPDRQDWFDPGPGADPLEVADRLGRPMAILRMGGRVPDPRFGPDAQFLGGCPPWVHYPPTLPVEIIEQSIPQSAPAAMRPGVMTAHGPRSGGPQ